MKQALQRNVVAIGQTIWSWGDFSQSEYADRFVFKVALMFTVCRTLQSRANRNIDLLARCNNSVDTMLGIFKDVCRQPVESDGVEFLSGSVRGAIIREDAEHLGSPSIFCDYDPGCAIAHANRDWTMRFSPW